MQSRVSMLLRILCLVVGIVAVQGSVAAQIRLSTAPKLKATAHPEDQTATTLALNLCVDGSATYPCPDPISSDTTYIPAITLTYGQVLDGVLAYGPPDLNTGTITLYKDVTAVCTLVIGVDHACPPNSTLFDVGTYTLTATLTFPPGSPYAETTAAPVAISVAQDPTSIALASAPNPAALGSPVTFTATVSGRFPAIPTGQVGFTLDDSKLPPVPLDASGTATYTTSSLALGTHTMTASYTGATDFLAADDATTRQQIVPPPTITTIASNLNPSAVGDSVTFTSTVSSGLPANVPMGSVTFKDGTTSFATVLVTPKGMQNIAQATIATLAAGTHSITAIYSGDASTSAGVSKVLVQQVDYPLTPTQPGYTLTVTPASVSLVAGAAANLTVTVTSSGGYPDSVALSCADLPKETSCLFGEAAIPAGGGTTTLALSTTSPHACGSSVPYGGYAASLHRPLTFGAKMRYAGEALACLLLLCSPRRYKFRAKLRTLFALIAACGMASLGCGANCTDFGTGPGDYTFKVVGSVPLTSPVTMSASPKSDGSIVATQTTSVALTVKP